MKAFLVIASLVLVAVEASRSPSSSQPIGPSYTSVQAVTTQFGSHQSQVAQQALRAAASVPQPVYSVPAFLLQRGSGAQGYDSVLQERSDSRNNPVLQAYGSPSQQQYQTQYEQSQQQQQQPQQQSRQLSQGHDNDQGLVSPSQQQPLSFDQYTSMLENGNAPLHSTPFHVSNDYTETPAMQSNVGSGDGQQTVVIHKHIHMHYFVRGAELPELPPVPEEKTFVYVLLKKPDGPPSIVFPTQVPTKPSKPEVYFIQYKDKKNQANGGSNNNNNNNDKPTGQSHGPPSGNDLGSHGAPSSSNNVPSSQYGARIAKSTSSLN